MNRLIYIYRRPLPETRKLQILIDEGDQESHLRPTQSLRSSKIEYAMT